MLELTNSNFQKEVLESDKPVLVDFWAPWCGPCQQMSPIIEELAEEHKDKGVKIVKLNVDEAGDVSSKFGIMSIPTFILFRDGKVVDKLIGDVGKEKLKELLQKYAA